VHRQPFHADPDPDLTFHFGADPDPDPILPSFIRVGKSVFFYSSSKPCQSTIFSRQRHRCHNFQYLDNVLKLDSVGSVPDPNSGRVKMTQKKVKNILCSFFEELDLLSVGLETSSWSF
jgi:hypothetical protein